MMFSYAKSDRGVTLVELLVALAIAALLMLGVIAAFQTAQRTAAIGRAREHIYQNARVALDLMANEIKKAYIDNRHRDFIFVSADGLAGRGNSILELTGAAATVYGLGNAQTPHGIDPTGKHVFRLYGDATFQDSQYTLLSVKAVEEIYNLYSLAPPGPPDRLDFICLTGLFPDNINNQSRLAEVRYIVTTESFIDDVDNDYDGVADELDSNPPGSGSITGLGDLVFHDDLSLDDLDPDTRRIKALSLFHLRRAIDIHTIYNPFSSYDYPVDIDPTATINLEPDDPYGRYPDRNGMDFRLTRDGENIGSYIYDLQFEFYGKIAIALDDNGAPEIWGVGWGCQDVRGEDVGLDGIPQAVGEDDPNPVVISQSLDPRRVIGDGSNWDAGIEGGMFIAWPSGTTEYDVTDPDADVYRIENFIDDEQFDLDRDFLGPYDADQYSGGYRIIEPTQANGILDRGGALDPVKGEDMGADGTPNDPLDDGLGIPNNVSNNDGNTAEESIGEYNRRLDSRVMGIWDSRSPDPRNPRRALELDGEDSDGDKDTYQSNGLDDDGDGTVDDTSSDPAGSPEADDPAGVTPDVDETNDLVDDDNGDTNPGDDGVADDRFYEPAGKPEGVDEPDEADPYDDTLPKAVRITISVSDPDQTLKPVVLSTTVWLSTAK